MVQNAASYLLEYHLRATRVVSGVGGLAPALTAPSTGLSHTTALQVRGTGLGLHPQKTLSRVAAAAPSSSATSPWGLGLGTCF